MAKPNLYSEHFQGYFQSYKLIAPNLFEYLQLIELINTVHITPCVFITFLDKVNLTIHIELFIYGGLAKITALLPAGIVMERD